MIPVGLAGNKLLACPLSSEEGAQTFCLMYQDKNERNSYRCHPQTQSDASRLGFPWTCVISQDVQIKYTQRKDPPCTGGILLVLETLGFGSVFPPPDLGMSWHSALPVGSRLQ